MEEITTPEVAEEENPPVEEPEEVQDPGQLEGIEKEHEPPPDHPRFKQVYGEKKHLEREVEKLKSERESEAAQLRAEIEALKAAKTAPVPPQQPEKQEPIPNPVSEKEQQLERLRTERKQARTDFDTEKADTLTDQIEDLMLDIVQEKQTVNEAAVAKAVLEAEQKAAVSAFKSKNTWLDEYNIDDTKNESYDPFKAGAAKELEMHLSKTWKGSYPDLLREIAKQVDTRFNGQPPKVPAVGGVGGAKPITNNKVVNLNEAQRKAALGFFPEHPNPEQAYAELLNQKGAN
jgi:hypothetical protein